jgi:acetyl esterase/lipase
MLSDNAAFVPAGSRERLTASLLRLITRLALRPALSPRLPIDSQRRWLKTVTRVLKPAKDVEFKRSAVGGGEWAWPRRQPPQTDASILYLHGGAYCIGSPATHRVIMSHLAAAAGLPVFAADYRLAPEHPFPAALEDAVAAYRDLSARGPVAVAGDSAGAGLALAMTLALRQENVAPAAALVLFSPWVDLTVSALAETTAPGEVMLSAAWLNACAQHYAAGQDAATPLLSPIFGDLNGLAPTLIQTSPEELLYEQAVRLHDGLDAAGVSVRCDIVRGRWHDFQLFAGVLPSAKAAITRAADFIVSNLAPAS